jgi:putative oligomerization/nucleic acid binding protein
MIMRRRPLLRAAAVGGTAYVAGKRRANRQAAEDQASADQDARISQLEQQQGGQQQQAYPAQAPAPAQPAASAGPASISDQLSQLKDLHDQGMLTDEEFSAAKAKVLGI